MNGVRRSTALGRLASQYGMAGVLLLLCLYFSWATLRPQQAVGEEAAAALAARVAASAPAGAKVLVVARTGPADALFADALQRLLVKQGFQVVRVVKGEPPEARAALEAAADAGGVDVVATTADSARWSVFERVMSGRQELRHARLLVPPAGNWPTFLKADNLLNVANQVVVIALLAAGMTLVIITGGIDLSVGSLVALSAVVSTLLIRGAGGPGATASAMVLCCAAGVAVCAATGAASGALVTFFGIPSFIATLAMMLVASGLAFTYAQGQSVYEVPESFTWLGRGASLRAVPNAVLLMLMTYAAAHVLMSRTVLGRYIYAVGGNAEAARLSGVRVWAVLLFVYTVSGAMAGLGGVVVSSQLKSGSPTYGLMYELYAIAAVVVGGTSLSGGSGRVLGTLIGAFIIAVIQNGMNLTNVESYKQKVVLGLVILGAVILDTVRRQGFRGLRQGSVVVR